MIWAIHRSAAAAAWSSRWRMLFGVAVLLILWVLIQGSLDPEGYYQARAAFACLGGLAVGAMADVRVGLEVLDLETRRRKQVDEA